MKKYFKNCENALYTYECDPNLTFEEIPITSISEPDIDPTIVLWEKNFSDLHPYYRLSFFPAETFSSMAKNLYGIDLPDSCSDHDYVQLNFPSGETILLARWEVFLRIAKRRQVRRVLSYVQIVRNNPKTS